MNINRQELKELLLQVKKNEYKVPEDFDAFELTLVMLDYLGDIDPELRDDLIYSTFWKWKDANLYTKEQLKKIVSIILDEKHLFYGLGESCSDTVFMRTFSMLLVAVIVYNHRKEPFLSKAELEDIKAKVIECMAREKDVRGYVEEGGWAHSAAHSSDVLDELAQCEELSHDDLLEILQAIKNKVCIRYHAYICYEDERLSIAATSLISRNVLSENEVVGWISSFKEFERDRKYPQYFYLISNIRNFLNSLYYRLPQDKYQKIKAAISDAVLDIRPF